MLFLDFLRMLNDKTNLIIFLKKEEYKFTKIEYIKKYQIFLNINNYKIKKINFHNDGDKEYIVIDL